MEVKGISVKSIPEFVFKHFPLQYNEWLISLPDESRRILNGYVFANNWYPLNSSVILPIKSIATFFYDDDLKTAAWTMGRYSAKIALNGVYKLFVEIGSPKYIIDKGSKVFEAYFRPSELNVFQAEKHSIVVQITHFPDMDMALEYNIGGWMEMALEISGCKNLKVDIVKSVAKQDELTEYLITWS